MDEDIVIVMVRKADGEMYVFEVLPTVRNCQQVQRQAGRWAANPELSFFVGRFRKSVLRVAASAVGVEIMITIQFESPRARTSDPVTSHLYAEEPQGEARRLALEAARQICSVHGDATANEIGRHGARLGTKSEETIRKRVHELRRNGWLVESHERRCKVTDRLCVCYRLAVGP